jgi:hypothetical protein
MSLPLKKYLPGLGKKLTIRTDEVADAQITEAKLGAASVTEAKLGAASVTEAKLGAAAVTKPKLAGAFLKVALADGTGVGADVTVAGVAVGDELVFVGAFATKASIATLNDRTSEYAIQAGGLDKAAGTDETGNQLMIIYLDLT